VREREKGAGNMKVRKEGRNKGFLDFGYIYFIIYQFVGHADERR
jgi:hypothetical protein